MPLSDTLVVVRDILADAGLKGMHVSDIAKEACARCKNFGLAVEDLEKKFSQALNANLKLKTSKPTFAKVNWDKGSRKGKPRQGWYRLKVARNTTVAPPPPPQVQNTYLGKGGEFAVISELLFWGYNASTMTVDDGIDIVASKKNLFFHIQVKTSTKQQSGKFTFTISKKSFERYNNQNVYYIFVLRDTNSNIFFVFPSSHLDYLIKSGHIGGNDNYSFAISQNNKKWLLNGTDIQKFLGDFNGIK